MNISVIGLGKLGAPLAAVLAHKGHNVRGVDLNETFVAAINDGRPPVEEPGLAEMIRDNRERLSASTEYGPAIRDTELTFMIVPTPSDTTGGFSLRYVMQSIEQIGAALRAKDGFHVVVLTSTVMPGATGGEVLPALERASGKLCGKDFGLCYNPEFIALGSVIRDMLRPDMILIGESDPRSGQLLEDHYRAVCDNEPAIARMNFVNAELTKLSVNTYVTTKISYANMLAEMCEQLPGADVDVVTAALGNDTRIGRKYLKGALGFGGPCFPRDNVAFCALARNAGAPAILAEATDKVNRRQIERLSNVVERHLPAGGRVGILGFSYKPNTPVIEESQAVMLARHLLDKGHPLVAYDPQALDNARGAIEVEFTAATSAADCARQADVLVITTPWEEFNQLKPEDLDTSRGKPTIIDCWRILSRDKFARVANYVTLGQGV